MTNQSTIDKLIEMRLTAMADAFRNQVNDPAFKGVPFEDQFGMLVDIEYTSRRSNRLKRLIKKPGLISLKQVLWISTILQGASLTKS